MSRRQSMIPHFDPGTAEIWNPATGRIGVAVTFAAAPGAYTEHLCMFGAGMAGQGLHRWPAGFAPLYGEFQGAPVQHLSQINFLESSWNLHGNSPTLAQFAAALESLLCVPGDPDGPLPGVFRANTLWATVQWQEVDRDDSAAMQQLVSAERQPPLRHLWRFERISAPNPYAGTLYAEQPSTAGFPHHRRLHQIQKVGDQLPGPGLRAVGAGSRDLESVLKDPPGPNNDWRFVRTGDVSVQATFPT